MFCRFRKFAISLSVLCWMFAATGALAEDVLPTSMDLQLAYVEANGGLANIQALSSLVINGIIVEADGETYDFKLYKKRPDLVRMQIDLPGGKRQVVYDGRSGFEWLSRPGGDDRVVELDAAEFEKIQFDADLDGFFFKLRSRPEWIEVLAEVEVDGLPAYELLISQEANSSYDRVWIGKDHYQEVKLSRIIELESGDDVLEEIYFSDFKKIRGVWIATTTRHERDGVITQIVRVDKVRANVGIFDSFFIRPKN